jgi:RHS repeat-associated protein
MQREYVWIQDKLVGVVDNAGGTPAIEAVTTGQIDEPLLVTAPDQSMLLDGYVDPYGNQGLLQATSYTLNQRLPGQYFQAGSGLSQNGWRDYDPSLGRYIEADPTGIDGGQNVYGYVDGDPLNLEDPAGLQGSGTVTVTVNPPYGSGIPQTYDVPRPAMWPVCLMIPSACIIPHQGSTSGSSAGSQAGNSTQTDCPDKKCPPCKTISGLVVPIGTIAYRPLDTPSRPQHGISGSHYNLYIANQAPQGTPKPCRCFWQPVGAVPADGLPSGAIPIEPFAN